ncbi:hypothetical protein [Hymenobacter metallicola]|uniref:Uncharacterized protein n=1 Tax=Hymenobacter metallicola TaxID=2563114 RepID=A0A4Z0PYH8_9BACT|nr:hypothetical protein [Hymenobacter metallicola]TGE22830.1 hypothetical protein E5K02_20915 [Hymenobacter metallicola]
MKPKTVLVRKADIAGVSRNGTLKKAVLITLVATKKGFLFEGLGSSNAARAELVPGKYKPSYKHDFDLVAFDPGPEQAETMEDLAADAEGVVSITPDNNGYYKVLGLNAGLRPSAMKTDSEDADLGGGIPATLSSDKEIGLADYFMVVTDGVYDAAATKTAFEALYA